MAGDGDVRWKGGEGGIGFHRDEEEGLRSVAPPRGHPPQ